MWEAPPVYPRQSLRVLPLLNRHHHQTVRGCLQTEGDPWASTRGAAVVVVDDDGGAAVASVAVAAGIAP